MANQQCNDDCIHELSLFTGAGGGILASELLGWHTICAVEINPYSSCVLAQRQNDGILPPFPIWDDVCTFNGRPWRGRIDVVSGGFPCQDISSAGKGAGITGKHSSLWFQMARIIGEVRPSVVFVENSPMLTSRGLGAVLGDLAALGYDARWGVLGAADMGAPHQRDRIWILAYTDREQLRELSGRSNGQGWTKEQTQLADDGEEGAVADTESGRQQSRWRTSNASVQRENGAENADDRGSEMASPSFIHAQRYNGRQRKGGFGGESWWAVEPNVGRVAHGVAARVDRLKVLGNGQVPLCAAEAFRLLTIE